MAGVVWSNGWRWIFILASLQILSDGVALTRQCRKGLPQLLWLLFRFGSLKITPIPLNSSQNVKGSLSRPD